MGINILFYFQVECKKAQPKEVMLPANLAKTRAAGRGAYGESLAGPSLRYAPYPPPGHGGAHAAYRRALAALAALRPPPARAPLPHAAHPLSLAELLGAHGLDAHAALYAPLQAPQLPAHLAAHLTPHLAPHFSAPLL